jgi:hypothetical protein
VSRRSAPRGQGVLEATLGMMVFVTVLMFGIFFTETLMAQLKVTEASSSTMWDITAGAPGDGFHTWPLDTSPTNTAVSNAQSQGQARYANFDGRVVAANHRTTANWTQVFSTASNMSVRCSQGVGLNYFPNLVTFQLRLQYSDVGGVQCLAQADITHGGLGGKIGNLADTGSGGKAYFNAKTYDARGGAAGGNIHSCSIGRATGGGCGKQMQMMVDDWGMSEGGGTGANTCPVLPFGIPCPNTEYWISTNLIYTATSVMTGTERISDPGRKLVTSVYNSAPGPIWIPFVSSPTSFYMSFMGEEAMFGTVYPTFWASDPWGWTWFWQTTPFLFWPTYAAAYWQGTGHYLGQAALSNRNNP